MLRKPEMVLIDLDGTLVDSVPDLTFCVDAMMQALGLPARGEALAGAHSRPRRRLKVQRDTSVEP